MRFSHHVATRTQEQTFVLVIVFLGSLLTPGDKGTAHGQAPQSDADRVDVVVVGGGSSPASSAVALEQNILDYKADLAALPINAATRAAQHVFLFGAGSDKAQLDVAEAQANISAEALLFARLVQGPTIDARLAFRHNRIEALDSAATREGVVQALEAQVRRASTGHQGRFYFTGHGLSGGPRHAPFSQNKIALWDGTLDVRSFTRLLSPLPDQGAYQIVMPQCYSGGFAHVLWEGADPKSGRFRPGRCGFFAQTAERLSAGCSPDLARRDEYSVSFFAALRGSDLAGRPVDADFDNDGRISSREAHGWVVATLASIDVPLSTSDAWLDVVIGRNPKAERRARGWPLAIFEKGFDSYEKAVFQKIQQRLGFRNPGSAPLLPFLESGVRTAGSRLEEQERVADAAHSALESALWQIQDELARKMPFFASPFSAHNGASLLPSPEVMTKAQSLFRSHTRFKEVLALEERVRVVEESALEALHTKAAWERVERLVRSSALRRAPFTPENLKNFQSLMRCESEPWWP
ncbi:MAG: hypothetical protein IOD12_17365 [Silvanigrellales bacterium]|nr:hypothetical protein [Silvanigrellales bacterium]